MTCDVVRSTSARLAMAPPGRRRSPLVQLIPFALILGIFYFVILLPMRRRQKKVEEFLAALKVGDKVVTTGGLYGAITQARTTSRCSCRLPTRSAIEVAAAAVGGYQGQEPVVPGVGSGLVGIMNKNLRWKVIAILGASSRAGGRRDVLSRPSQKIKLGLDLKGGVHLVLRVQTDDALRSRPRLSWSGCARQLTKGRRRPA